MEVTEENDSTTNIQSSGTRFSRGKKHGGLGIRNLKKQSKTLRLNWLWRYSQEPQPYWEKVIQAKYGEENKWMTKEVLTPWKSINLVASLKEQYNHQGRKWQ